MPTPTYGIVKHSGKVHKINKRPDGDYPHCCGRQINNIIPLGKFPSAVEAVAWAKKNKGGYTNITGCGHCSAEAAY